LGKCLSSQVETLIPVGVERSFDDRRSFCLLAAQSCHRKGIRESYGLISASIFSIDKTWLHTEHITLVKPISRNYCIQLVFEAGSILLRDGILVNRKLGCLDGYQWCFSSKDHWMQTHAGKLESILLALLAIMKVGYG
jgi:hypothetical protein